MASGTNLAGLVQHLTFVESKWFEGIVAGATTTQRSPIDARRSVGVAARPAGEYRAACAASDAIIARIGDADAPVRHGDTTRNLRWALLAVIEETARHAGHADIIREQLDGTTGR